jgi:hypothetical protein
MVFLPGSGAAQQQPITGCNAAPSCRDRGLGYSALKGNAGGSVLFGVGFRWGPGFQLLIVTPKPSLAPEPTPSVDTRIFHLRDVSLLPPQPTPTPLPKHESRGQSCEDVLSTPNSHDRDAGRPPRPTTICFTGVSCRGP